MDNTGITPLYRDGNADITSCTRFWSYLENIGKVCEDYVVPLVGLMFGLWQTRTLPVDVWV